MTLKHVIISPSGKIACLLRRHESMQDELFFTPELITERALQDALREWIALAKEITAERKAGEVK